MDAALTNHDSLLRNEGAQPAGVVNINIKSFKVAVVNAYDFGATEERLFYFIFVVYLNQTPQTEAMAQGYQFLKLFLLRIVVINSRASAPQAAVSYT